MSRVSSMHAIVGTAGHIDHGKTALVRCLTGVDTDRLPEEKRRGITIVLGFAPLDLGDGKRVGVVDVPGHERFVKNMVAGAGGIDLVLLVVAADEGVMPQTREHVEICTFLGVRRGVVAVTKIDKAGPELTALALDDLRSELRGTFLEQKEIVPCSAVTGDGIDELRRALARELEGASARTVEGSCFLPIDRSFAVRGFGTVVTGTLLSGTISVGQAVDVRPEVPGRTPDKPPRVRGLQVFGEDVDRARAGQRTAVNLQGIDLDSVAQGSVLVSSSTRISTQRAAVFLEYSKSRTKPLESGAAILFHVGTALVSARVTLLGTKRLDPGETAFAMVRTRRPVATFSGQRFIARGFDAIARAGRTIAGGVVLDPHPSKRRKAEVVVETMQRLRDLAENGPDDGRLDAAISVLVREKGSHGIALSELTSRLGVGEVECRRAGASVHEVNARSEHCERRREGVRTGSPNPARAGCAQRGVLAPPITRKAETANNAAKSVRETSRGERLRAGKSASERRGGVVVLGDRLIDRDALEALADRILEIADAFHREYPLREGVSSAELATRLGRDLPSEVVVAAVEHAVRSGALLRKQDALRLRAHTDARSRSEGREKLLDALHASGLEPPSTTELEAACGLSSAHLRELIALCARSGEIVSASASLHFGRAAFDDAKAKVLDCIAREGAISTARAKELLGVSRKFLIPFLETLDKQNATVRVGDVRKARGVKA